MMWIDIACVLFACTAANHLGLISAVEKLIRHRLPVLNCAKCLTFWCTLAVTLVEAVPVTGAIAISFLAAYLAVWLELAMGFIDTLYNRLYDTIYPKAADDTAAAGPDEGDTDGDVPDMRKDCNNAEE